MTYDQAMRLIRESPGKVARRPSWETWKGVGYHPIMLRVVLMDLEQFKGRSYVPTEEDIQAGDWESWEGGPPAEESPDR